MVSVGVVGLANSQLLAGPPDGAPGAAADALCRQEAINHIRVSKQVRVVNHDGAPDITLCLLTDLDAARETWTAFQASAWSTPFQSFDWIRSWYAQGPAASNIRPTIILGYAGDDLQFILPLGVEPFLGARRLCWLAGDINDYNAPLVEPAFAAGLSKKMAAEIWHGIAKIVGDVDVFHLTKQPSHIAGAPNHFRVAGAVASSCASHMLTLQSDWDSLYKRLRSSKTRSRLRQKEVKLRREGALAFKFVRNSTERHRVIDQILKWKGDQLARSGDRNPYVNTILQQTIVACSDVATETNQLQVCGLYLDNHLISGIIAFVGNETFFLFATAYDPKAFSHCSPGTLLLLKTLEFSARAGLRTYDFLGGDEVYKNDWCNQTLILEDSFLGVTRVGRLDARLSHWVLKCKKYLKANVTAMALLRKVNNLRGQARPFAAFVEGRKKQPHVAGRSQDLSAG